MKAVALPRFSATGEFQGYVGSTFDITDIKEAETTLQEADRRKDEFLALLGHGYGYKIIAVNSAGESQASSPTGAFAVSAGGSGSGSGTTPADTTAPAVPTNLAVNAGDATATITWTDPADSDLSTIKIFRGTTSGSLTLLATVEAGVEVHTDTPLTNATTYYYALTATDSSDNVSSQTAEVSDTPRAPLEITTVAIDLGQVGVAYSETLAATGGEAPYNWAITAGTLPAGLTLSGATGEISGTPTEDGNFPITVQLEDTALAGC